MQIKDPFVHILSLMSSCSLAGPGKANFKHNEGQTIFVIWFFRGKKRALLLARHSLFSLFFLSKKQYYNLVYMGNNV